MTTLVTFAPVDDDQHALAIDVLDTQPADFAHTQACTVSGRHDRLHLQGAERSE
jgi:hypothetical protein